MTWILERTTVIAWHTYEAANARAQRSYVLNPLSLSDLLDQEDGICSTCRQEREPGRKTYCRNCAAETQRAKWRDIKARKKEAS